MRFLHEDPWQRRRQLREKVPNICFQMLLRASNAVGYTSYPDNVVREFVLEAARQGIDVFRIFDSLNSVDNMQVAVDAVLETGALCEAAICYTGDICDRKRPKYNLDYYVKMAKQLEAMGAHILGIKDMAGLCKPPAAYQLVSALRQEIELPIHLHTHDTSGINAATLLRASEGLVERANQPAQRELPGGGVAPYAPRYAARRRRSRGLLTILGDSADLLPALRQGSPSRQRGRVSARDPRRTIH
jgi:pyruvate carboxylase